MTDIVRAAVARAPRSKKMSPLPPARSLGTPFSESKDAQDRAKDANASAEGFLAERLFMAGLAWSLRRFDAVNRNGMTGTFRPPGP